MEKDAGNKTKEMRVDGGASENNFLMQFQADLLDCTVTRPKVTETTALGAAFLAGLAVGYWPSIDALKELWEADQGYEPKMAKEKVANYLHYWHKAVERSKNWQES